MNQWKEWIKGNAARLFFIAMGSAGSVLLSLLYEPLAPFHLFINISFIVALIYSGIKFMFGNQQKYWKWSCLIFIAFLIAMNHLYDYQVVLHLCPFLREYSPAALGGSMIVIIICIICGIKLLGYIDWNDLFHSGNEENEAKNKISSKWILGSIALLIGIILIAIGNVWLSKQTGNSKGQIMQYVCFFVLTGCVTLIGIVLFIKAFGGKSHRFIQSEHPESQKEKAETAQSEQDAISGEDRTGILENAKKKLMKIAERIVVDILLGSLFALVTYMKFIPDFFMDMYELIFEDEEEEESSAEQ